MSLRCPLPVTAVSRTRSVPGGGASLKSRPSTGGPASTARSPAIPAPSPTPRSCGGARALLIPCLPARPRSPAARSVCGGRRVGLAGDLGGWLCALAGPAERRRAPLPGAPRARAPLARCRAAAVTHCRRLSPSVRLGARWPAGRGPGSVRRFQRLEYLYRPSSYFCGHGDHLPPRLLYGVHPAYHPLVAALGPDFHQ